MGPLGCIGPFRVYGTLYTYTACLVIFLSVLDKTLNTIHIRTSITART